MTAGQKLRADLDAPLRAIDTTGNTNRLIGSIAIRTSVTRGAADPGVGRAAFPLRPISGVASESWCKSTSRFTTSPSAYGLRNSGDRPARSCR